MSKRIRLDFKAGVSTLDVPTEGFVGGICGKHKIVVVRKHGQLYALSAECTHLGADLSTGALTGTSLRCPWHHARFDIYTGEAVGAPAFEPLERFEISEHDGRVVVGEKVKADKPAAKAALDKRVVIVGAGAGGHACAEWLSRRGVGENVTLIGDENTEPYDRTFCSKQILAGKKNLKDAALAPLPGVRRLMGATVNAINAGMRSVTLANGEQVSYDALVLATGAESVSPQFEGAERPNVYVLRTFEDTQAILKAAKSAERVGIVGASFIALEVAASLKGHGLDVTVIAPDEIPLAGKMGEEVGRFVQTLHEDQGVKFKLGHKPTSFDGKALHLDNGEKLVVDFIVAGIGVTPRLELARSAGLALADKAGGGGVKVDSQLLTSEAHIYAIGDIASFTDVRLNSVMRVEHWAVAQRQGQFVARHLLDESSTYVDTPFFWSGHYDQSLRYIGHGKPKEREVQGDIASGDFVVTYLEGETAAAQLACGRDQAVLATEAEWDAEALGTDTAFGS